MIFCLAQPIATYRNFGANNMKPQTTHLLIAAGLALLLSACPSENADTTQTGTQSSASSPAAQPAGEAHPVGQPVPAEELVVIVHGSRSTASIDELGDPARKSTAASGETFVIVAVEIGNNGQQPAAFSLLSAEPKLIDAQGQPVDMDFLSAASLRNAFPEGSIPPGGSLKGEIPFKLKGEPKDLKFSLSPSLAAKDLLFRL